MEEWIVLKEFKSQGNECGTSEMGDGLRNVRNGQNEDPKDG